MEFGDYYRNKKVIITGHTGFKGTWLANWLKLLGANVIGVSDGVPTEPSHYKLSGLSDSIENIFLDIRNKEKVSNVINTIQPDIIFHLAAQALVNESYMDPVKTIETNTLGTVNVLDALRVLKNKCAVVLITSDKSYENLEWEWGYREIDKLGGIDPYSASKGATELLIRGYIKSFFPKGGEINIATARAGNVIGGGDWANSRIIPDCIRAWAKNKTVQIRNPKSTRPWQHVLEPLSGYLALAVSLATDKMIHGEVFNFGPSADQDQNVLELVQEMSKHWKKVTFDITESKTLGVHEAGLLKLNCDKALYSLHWRAVLNFKETVDLTANWYRLHYESPESDEKHKMSLMKDITRKQIEQYCFTAKQRGLKWAL